MHAVDEVECDDPPSPRLTASSSTSLCNQEIISALTNYSGTVSPFASTVLLLLGEMHSTVSNFQKYIDGLPKDMLDCLIAWSPDELRELQGTVVESFDGHAFRSLYETVLLPFMNHNKHLFDVLSVSYEEVLRVACLVQSRAFHMQKDNWVTQTAVEGTDLIIIPGIDMVNHSCTRKGRNATLSRLERTQLESLASVSITTNAKIQWYFCLQAERRIEAGEEVLLSYGDLSDGELLSIYGFIGSNELERNPYGTAALLFDNIVECCCSTAKQENWDIGMLGERRKFLEDQKLGSRSPGALCLVSADKPLPDSLLTIVQTLLMPDKELQSLMSSIGQLQLEGVTCLDLGRDHLATSDWCETALLALFKIIDASMKSYLPSSAASKNAHKLSELPNRKRLAMQLMASELEILTQAKSEVVQLLLENETDSGSSSGRSTADDSDSQENSFIDGKLRRKKIRLA